MFYQAHRGKFVGKHESGFFDRVDYDTVTGRVGNDAVEHNVVGYQVIKQYLSAICMIFGVQKRQGLVKSDVGALMSDRLKDLINLVCKRKERVMVELCKEQLDG